MEPELQNLLCELEAFGEMNDASGVERPRRMLNITRDTGEFLSVLVTAMNARHILEVGTSNGYSTLWLASAAARISGAVRTIEHAEYKIDLARENFTRAGLSGYIDLIPADAGAALKNFTDAAFDLIFLDSERSEYVSW